VPHGCDIRSFVAEHVGCRYQGHGKRNFGTVDLGLRVSGDDDGASVRLVRLVMARTRDILEVNSE
jgi:hypothetical protein